MADDLPRCRRFLAVMGEMDRHYRGEAHDRVIPRMLDPACAYYLGEGDDFELAIGFQWDGAREAFGLRTMGFVGNIEPHEALDLFVPHFLSFMRERSLRWIFAIQPIRMDNPRILQLYGLVPWRTDVVLTGGHHVQDGIYWRISPAQAIPASHVKPALSGASGD